MKSVIRDIMVVCGMGGGGRKKNFIQRAISRFHKMVK